MRRIALFVLPLITFFSPSASALTVHDVVELTRAGLGEDIILALIEVDPSVFPIDTATLKMLKDAGVSQRVIVAMVRSARTQPPVAAEAVAGNPVQPVVEESRAPEPQVIVIDHHDTAVQQVPVAVPVYVPVPVKPNHRSFANDHVRNVPDPYDASRRLEVRQGVHSDTVDVGRTRSSQPVYWGFGGQLRPDAWQPAGAKKEPEKKEKDR
jgi:hypothetical protein